MMSNELLKRKILDSIYNNKDNNYVIEKVIKVFDIVGGSQPPKSQFSEDEKDGYVRLYQTRDYGEKPVPVYVEKNSVSKFTKKGDILLARYGGSLGKVFIAEEGAYNVALAKVIIKDSKRFYNKFVYYYFLSSKYQNFTKSLSKMAQAGFNKNDLSDLTIIIPPLEEQYKIANKIEELFELIDKKEKNDEEKEKLKVLLKEKILDSAIHGELVKNDLSLPAIDVEEAKEDIPFDIPSNWKWTLVKNITNNIQYGYTASAIEEGNVRFLRITDIQGENINWQSVPFCNIDQNIKENYILHKNDIIVARTGGTVGKSFMINEIENCVFASYLIRLVPSNIYPKYLKYYMNTSYYWKQIWNNAKGMAQPGVNSKTLANMLITVPPFEQQKKIVEKIEECFKLIEQL